MRVFSPAAVVFGLFIASLGIPSSSIAQESASIVGLVRDGSGGVMPGVTIEASSPALIERVRSAVSDEAGRFSIVSLRPGEYTVTFTLPGFKTIRREGIVLEGAFAATINADLEVGGLEETITVTGASPIVDLQSTQNQFVANKQILDALPGDPHHAGRRQPGAGRELFSAGICQHDVGARLKFCRPARLPGRNADRTEPDRDR